MTLSVCPAKSLQLLFGLQNLLPVLVHQVIVERNNWQVKKPDKKQATRWQNGLATKNTRPTYDRDNGEGSDDCRLDHQTAVPLLMTFQECRQFE